MRFLPIYLILLLYFNNTFSQKKLSEIKFENLSVEQGLSNSKVNCIFQDSQGFIWIGTTNGLNRYDGYEFKIFINDKNDPESIVGNGINKIIEDQKGRLWIGTENGLDMYDREREVFVHYQNDPKDGNALADNKVYDLFLDKISKSNTKLWIGTRNGLNCFIVERDTFIHYPEGENFLSHYNVKSIDQDREGNLWIATFGGGVNYLETSSGKIKRFLHNPKNPNSIGHNLAHTLAIDNTGVVWVGTFGGGLDKYEPKNGKWTHYPSGQNNNTLNHERVRAVFPDNSSGEFGDCIWVGTWGGGINLLNKRNETISHLTSNTFLESGLRSNTINTFYKDNTGILWVGTSDGIHRYDPKIFKIKNIKSEPKGLGGLGNHEIVVLFTDSQDRIWIGTRGGGLNLYFQETGEFVAFNHNPENPNSLVDNSVTDIKEDKEGNLWISTENGLSKFNVQKKEFKNFQSLLKKEGEVKNSNIHRIFIDTKENVWLLYWYDGVGKLNIKTEELTHFQHFDTNLEKSENKLARSIYEDKNGDIFIGTTSSIEKCNPISGEFEHFNLNQSITGIWQDELNNYWLIADGHLTQFNFLTLEQKVFPIEENYNVLQSFVMDTKGKFWLGSNNGIHFFDVQNQNFKYYNERDGLQGRAFNWNAATRNGKGELFFGGNNGFNIFHPDSLIDNPYLPKIVLTEFKLFNKIVKPKEGSLLKNSISSAKEIILKYDQNVISFGFAALNYTLSAKNQYAYRLENFENNWNKVLEQRTATYTNLDAGNYVFRVKASNNDGIWNEEGVGIKVIVLPPWWETIWFRVLMVALVIGLGVLFYKLRTRALKKQKRILAHKVSIRTKEVMDQKEEIIFQKKNIEEKNRMLEIQQIALIQKQVSLTETNQKLKIANDSLEKLAKLIQQANIKLDQDNVLLKQKVEEETKARIMLKGVDFEEFKKIYPDANSCYAYLNEIKWKNGYQCLKCGNVNYSLGKTPLSRRCSKCGYDESVTTHTIFFRLKFPIVKAFYLVFIICAYKDISIQELSEKLSLRRQTCSTFKQKLLKEMEKKKKVTGNKDGWGYLVLDQEYVNS